MARRRGAGGPRGEGEGEGAGAAPRACIACAWRRRTARWRRERAVQLRREGDDDDDDDDRLRRRTDAEEELGMAEENADRRGEDEPPSRQTTVDVLEAGDGAAAWLDAVDRPPRRDSPPPTLRLVPTLRLLARRRTRSSPWNVTRGIRTGIFQTSDLLIVFGEHFHLAGYPAWADVEERRFIASARRGGFTRERFESLLRRYANTARTVRAVTFRILY